MRIRFYMTAVLTSALLGLFACSSLQSARHEYVMRGQVVEIWGNEAVICIGSRDGAQVGQQLNAYKLVSTSGGPRSGMYWQKVKVGTVRIAEVFDEHFAKAQIITGAVEVNYIVELNH